MRTLFNLILLLLSCSIHKTQAFAGLHVLRATNRHVRFEEDKVPVRKSFESKARGRIRARSSTISSSSPTDIGPTPVATPNPPKYDEILASILNLVKDGLVLAPYDVPQHLQHKQSTVGKGAKSQDAKVVVEAYSAPKFRQIRSALVTTTGPTQVLNFVMYPDPSYDLPIFGVDLVSLPGGHIICIDFQPAAPISEHPQLLKHYDEVKHISKKWSELLPSGGDLPKGVADYFSPHVIWSRAKDSQIVDTVGKDALLEYLKCYLNAAEAATKVGDSSFLQVLEAGHISYSRYRRINDPGRGMLGYLFGVEWTEDLIENVLFDLEKKLGIPLQ